MKTYLVTGGAGFIGSNFIIFMLNKYDDIKIVNIDKLTYAGNLENLKSVENNPNYEFIQADICDKAIIKHIFNQFNVDYVVNFAAESHVDRSIREPELFVKTNVIGTVNLLNAAKEAWTLNEEFIKGKKFLHVSTDEVYGSLGKIGFFTETTPLDPHSPYSASKASSDMMVKAYLDTYGMPINITRCSNNYGPYQFPEKLIPLIIKNILEGEDLPVYGDGTNVRDWLYVEDHCKAIDLVLHNGIIGEVYNVGGHNEKQNIEIVKLTIDEIKLLIESSPKYWKALKTDLSNVNYNLIKYVKDRKGHDKRYAIDPSKITKELGWYPETKFEDGIVKTIIWYLENQNWVDDVVSGDYQEYYTKMYKER